MRKDVAIVGMSCRFCNVKDRHSISKLYEIKNVKNDYETLIQRGQLVQDDEF